MRKIGIMVLLLFIAHAVFAVKLGTLKDVLKPQMIDISGDKLYVLENGARVSVYSLQDLSLIRKFGKTGEGPGEVNVSPFYVNSMTVSGDQIVVDSINKYLIFSTGGKLLKEMKKTPSDGKITAVGKNFVGGRLRPNKDSSTHSRCVTLYDSKMEVIKDLYCQEDIWQGNKFTMVIDLIHFKVYDDKIFIEESPGGFLIEVFDSLGKKLYKIEKEYQQIRFTAKHKQELINEFNEEPFVKERGGFDRLMGNTKKIYPDFFPPIQSVDISGKKLYIRTYKAKENKEEYIIMDLQGNIIKNVFLPRFRGVHLMAKLAGLKLHTIENDKLYYFIDNEETEEWELYVEEIK